MTLTDAERESFGINQPDDYLTLEVPTDILCSYHYFGEVDMSRLASWGLRIIGDSGAFSAMTSGNPITLGGLHTWAHQWKDSLLWVAALDEIGDTETTFKNWIDSKKDGLDLVPTLHYGATPKDMDRLVENGASLIGLGGMVPYSSEPQRLMRWCLSMHLHARDHHPHVRFHGWGISHPYLLDNLPWWSADSSGFSSCFRFGTLRLWIPKRGKFVSVDLNGRDIAQHSRLLSEVYGTDWKLITRSTPENRRVLGRVALRAVQLYGEWLQSRQQVSPPELLRDKIREASGPRITAAPGGDTSLHYVSPKLGVGPVPVSAQGSPQFQGFKSLAPTSVGPKTASATVRNESWNSLSPAGEQSLPNAGPNPVAAMGGVSSAQGRSVSPNGKIFQDWRNR